MPTHASWRWKWIAKAISVFRKFTDFFRKSGLFKGLQLQRTKNQPPATIGNKCNQCIVIWICFLAVTLWEGFLLMYSKNYFMNFMAHFARKMEMGYPVTFQFAIILAAEWALLHFKLIYLVVWRDPSERMFGLLSYSLDPVRDQVAINQSDSLRPEPSSKCYLN